jgi:hypothetical protein
MPNESYGLDEWPDLSTLVLSSRFETIGCPALAPFARAGTMLLAQRGFSGLEIGTARGIAPTHRKGREESGTHFH